MEASVRITGGDAKGRPIRGPGGSGIRPTSDRVREALFDVLGARVADAKILDGFAGTGAVGVEALSRGADRVVFLEKDRAALRLIRENLALHAWTGKGEILAGEIGRSLDDLERRGERFSVIFLDPPYDGANLEIMLARVGRVLAPGGIVVVEHRSSLNAKAPADSGLRRFRSYPHGDSALTSFLADPTVP
jgi:16S rRNA (guanine966-N2)-methyltransferase